MFAHLKRTKPTPPAPAPTKNPQSSFLLFALVSPAHLRPPTMCTKALGSSTCCFSILARGATVDRPVETLCLSLQRESAARWALKSTILPSPHLLIITHHPHPINLNQAKNPGSRVCVGRAGVEKYRSRLPGTSIMVRLAPQWPGNSGRTAVGTKSRPSVPLVALAATLLATAQQQTQPAAMTICLKRYLRTSRYMRCIILSTYYKVFCSCARIKELRN